jgi:hypothetical protein
VWNECLVKPPACAAPLRASNTPRDDPTVQGHQWPIDWSRRLRQYRQHRRRTARTPAHAASLPSKPSWALSSQPVAAQLVPSSTRSDCPDGADAADGADGIFERRAYPDNLFPGSAPGEFSWARKRISCCQREYLCELNVGPQLCGLPQLIRLDQKLRRNFPCIVDSIDHLGRECALP